MILPWIGLTGVLGYILVYLWKSDWVIPDSLSDTYYSLGHWFTGIIWFFSGCLFLGLIEETQENFQFLVFLMSAGLMFVGAAPEFKSDMISRSVHLSGAYTYLISGTFWILLGAGKWWLLFGWIPVLIWRLWSGKTEPRTFVWWVEIVSTGLLYLCLV